MQIKEQFRTRTTDVEREALRTSGANGACFSEARALAVDGDTMEVLENAPGEKPYILSIYLGGVKQRYGYRKRTVSHGCSSHCDGRIGSMTILVLNIEQMGADRRFFARRTMRQPINSLR
jgi:hypothetical protein